MSVVALTSRGRFAKLFGILHTTTEHLRLPQTVFFNRIGGDLSRPWAEVARVRATSTCAWRETSGAPRFCKEKFRRGSSGDKGKTTRHSAWERPLPALTSGLGTLSAGGEPLPVSSPLRSHNAGAISREPIPTYSIVQLLRKKWLARPLPTVAVVRCPL